MPNYINLNSGNSARANCGLSGLCATRGMSERDLSLLEDVIDHQRQCDRKEYLYRSGEEMNAIYAVRTGSFKVTILDAAGEEQILGFYFPGDLIGLEGFGEASHSCDVVALESASVCQFSFSKLDKMCDRIPSLRRRLMALLGREISNGNRMLLALGKMNAEERIATFLIDIAGRFAQRGFSRIDFNLSMSRHDIANYLGMAVETVSRLLSRLQSENLISVHHRNVHIENLDGLRSLAHEPAVALTLQRIDNVRPLRIAS